jgi:pyruvate kinase
LTPGVVSCRERGWIKTGDAVVCVHGQQEATSGSTNMLRVMIA